MAILVCLAISLAACDESPSPEASSQDPTTTRTGFEAVITGAYDGTVFGAGVLKLLPEAGFDRQGYYFLSDGQGVRPHGVTFVLPRDLAPGKYRLESPSPLNLGAVPSVRVDRDMGSSVQSSGNNTSGFLELTAVPKDEITLTGSAVAGNFTFETEAPNGRRIHVSGTFSFAAE